MYTATSFLCVFVGNWHSLWGGINRSSLLIYCPAVCPLWHHNSLVCARQCVLSHRLVWLWDFNQSGEHEFTLSRAGVFACLKFKASAQDARLCLRRNLCCEVARQTGRERGAGLEDRKAAKHQRSDWIKRVSLYPDQSLSLVERPYIKTCLPLSITCTCNQMNLTVLRIVSAL